MWLAAKYNVKEETKGQGESVIGLQLLVLLTVKLN